MKTGLARMLKGGVIMDVVNAEQVRAPVSAMLCKKIHYSYNNRQE